jgi:hypothetical protein
MMSGNEFECFAGVISRNLKLSDAHYAFKPSAREPWGPPAAARSTEDHDSQATFTSATRVLGT